MLYPFFPWRNVALGIAAFLVLVILSGYIYYNIKTFSLQNKIEKLQVEKQELLLENSQIREANKKLVSTLDIQNQEVLRIKATEKKRIDLAQQIIRKTAQRTKTLEAEVAYWKGKATVPVPPEQQCKATHEAVNEFLSKRSKMP